MRLIRCNRSDLLGSGGPDIPAPPGIRATTAPVAAAMAAASDRCAFPLTVPNETSGNETSEAAHIIAISCDHSRREQPIHRLIPIAWTRSHLIPYHPANKSFDRLGENVHGCRAGQFAAICRFVRLRAEDQVDYRATAP